MEMNSRERVLAALKCEEPDRVPYFELAVDRALAQDLMGWGKESVEASASLVRNTYTVEESKELAAFLGMDNIAYILRAPAYAHMGKGAEGRGFFGEGMVKAEADLSVLDLPDPYDDALYAEAEEFVKNKGDYALTFVTRAGMFQAILSLGIQNFALTLYDNPKLIEKLLDIYFDWTTVAAERVCGMGFDVFCTTDDFAFKTGLFFSPDVFRDLMVPRYKRMLEKVTIPWILHSDGNLGEAVDMIVDLGAAGIHPNEKGAMDIRAMKRDYGDRICLLGNVDLNILGMGTPEEADREVRELIRDVGPGGGYVVSSGNSLASYLKPECVVAMCKAIKKYGQYPIELS